MVEVAKPRMGVMLRQSVGAEKSANRSAELEELRSQYQTLCKHFRELDIQLKKRHASLVNTAESRAAVRTISSIVNRVFVE